MWQAWEINAKLCPENLGEEDYLKKAWLKN
jgi:hypothetical protein